LMISKGNPITGMDQRFKLLLIVPEARV